MSVRILEVARVPAPPGVMRRFDHDGPGPRGLGHDFVDFDFGSHVVPNGARGRLGRPSMSPVSCAMLVRGQSARSGPPAGQRTRRPHTRTRCLQCRPFQAKPIAVEPDGRLQIIHAKGDERDPSLHTQTLHKTVPVLPGPCGPEQARGEVRAGGSMPIRSFKGSRSTPRGTHLPLPNRGDAFPDIALAQRGGMNRGWHGLHCREDLLGKETQALFGLSPGIPRRTRARSAFRG